MPGSRRALLVACARSAIRALSFSPGFSVALGLSYGLGLAVVLTTAAHASRYGLRAPPGIADARHLKRIYFSRSSGAPYDLAPVLSYPELRLLQRYQRGVQVEAFSTHAAIVRTGNMRHRVMVGLTSSGFLQVLGVTLQAGRFPSVLDETSGDAVAVISDRLWKKLFARSRAAIGRVISINGQPVTVLGVLSRDFHGLERELTDAWLPARTAPVESERRRLSAESFHLSAVVRIRNIEHTSDIERMLLDALTNGPSNGGRISEVRLGRIAEDRLERNFVSGRAVLLAFTMVAGALVLALSNCLLLVLSRIQSRIQETITMSALGAPAWTPVATIAIEVVLVVAPVTAGVALLVAKSTSLFQPAGSSGAPPVVDGFLLAVTAFVAVATLLIVSGCAMLAVATRLNGPMSSVRSSPKTGTLRTILVAGYVAVVSALAVGSLPIWRAYLATTSVQPGFDAADVIVGTVSGRSPATDPSRPLADVDAAAARLQAFSFALVVGASTGLPYRTTDTRAVAHEPDDRSPQIAHVNYVRGNFLPALGVPVDVGDANGLALSNSVIINRKFASDRWTGIPVGKCVYLDGTCGPVVAMTANTNVVGFGEDPRPIVYTSMVSSPHDETVHFVIRAWTKPTARMIRLVDEALGAAFPTAITKTELMDDIVREQSAALRLVSLLLAMLLLAATGLAVFGLLASVAYSVEQRRRDLGIRAALGATPLRVMLSASSDFVLAGTAGALAGAVLGMTLARLVAVFVPALPVSPIQQIAIGLAVALLLLAFGAAPAWLVARQQPLQLVELRID